MEGVVRSVVWVIIETLNLDLMSVRTESQQSTFTN